MLNAYVSKVQPLLNYKFTDPVAPRYLVNCIGLMNELTAGGLWSIRDSVHSSSQLNNYYLIQPVMAEYIKYIKF